MINNWTRNDNINLAVLGIGFVIGTLVLAAGGMPSVKNPLKAWFVTTLFFSVGLILFFSAFREYRRKTLVRDTPTSDIKSIAIGLVEVNGKVKPDGEMLESPFTGQKCVYYEYEVEEYRRTDDDSRWVTIDSGKSSQPFIVDDGTGEIEVDVPKADSRVPPNNTFTESHFSDLPGPAQSFLENTSRIDTQAGEWSQERRRYTEHYVKPGGELYVFGKALPREKHAGSAKNPENAYITADKTTPMFMFSTHSEKELLSKMSRNVWLQLIFGFGLSVGMFALLLALTGFV